MIKQEDNFYTCNRCGQRVFTDWEATFHIHPLECHTPQIVIEQKPLFDQVPIGIASCI